jgi:REP element-mobilizing transposase RayT
MPDHLHALVSFPPDESMQRVVTAWKRYVARETGVGWQRGFFDHRLRTAESAQEKHAYVRANPVREDLCADEDQWQYW